MAENGWRNNDLAFISIVVEPVSRDYELRSPVSLQDSRWSVYRVAIPISETSSFKSLSVGQTWLSRARPAFQARLIYDRVTGSFHVRAARNSTLLVRHDVLAFFESCRAEHYVISFSCRIRDDAAFPVLSEWVLVAFNVWWYFIIALE